MTLRRGYDSRHFRWKVLCRLVSVVTMRETGPPCPRGEKIKGVWRMRADSFKDFVLDQLSQVPQLMCKAMFGGHGLYQRDTFFGIIHKGRLYLKTTGMTQPAYASRGMQPFRPNRKQLLKQYYEVPVDILENAEQLTIWALLAVTAPSPQLPLPFHDNSAMRDVLAPM